MADAGAAGGHQWKQIRIINPMPGSNGSIGPGTVGFVAADLLATGGAISAGLGTVASLKRRGPRGGKLLSGW
jgi:hypothetical protein